MINRYVDDIFLGTTSATIGVSFKRKKIDVYNLTIDSQIWDFGGEEKYRILFPAYVHGAAAALVLYDTTNRETLEEVKEWMQILDRNASNIVKVLIGAKSDLNDQKEVNLEDAKKISQECGCYDDPVETSSKTGDNVEVAFLKIARGIVERQLQKCPACKKMFAKKLKICQYCGENIVLEIIST